MEDISHEKFQYTHVDSHNNVFYRIHEDSLRAMPYAQIELNKRKSL